MTPEGRVKQLIKAWMERLGMWSFQPVSNGMGAHGIPDRIGCLPLTVTPEMVGKTIGVFVAVEAKAPGKKHNTSPLQRAQIAAISKAHGFVVVADCADDLTKFQEDIYDCQRGKQGAGIQAA